jgi:hypothetical protein
MKAGTHLLQLLQCSFLGKKALKVFFVKLLAQIYTWQRQTSNDAVLAFYFIKVSSRA